MRKNTKKRYLTGLVICLITGVGVYFTEQSIENNFRQELKDSLLSLVNATKTPINIISNNNKNILESGNARLKVI